VTLTLVVSVNLGMLRYLYWKTRLAIHPNNSCSVTGEASV